LRRTHFVPPYGQTVCSVGGGWATIRDQRQLYDDKFPATKIIR
jgi:hypothetical protein